MVGDVRSAVEQAVRRNHLDPLQVPSVLVSLSELCYQVHKARGVGEAHWQSRQERRGSSPVSLIPMSRSAGRDQCVGWRDDLVIVQLP